MKRFKRMMAVFCAAALIAESGLGSPAQAAKKQVFLSKTKITLKVGKSRTLKVRKSGKVRIRKRTFQSGNKMVATVTKKGRITAKRVGGTTIKVTVKYKSGRRLRTRILKCNVTVVKRAGNSKSDISRPSRKPVVSPSPTPEVSPSPTPEAGADLTISSVREMNEFVQKVNNGNSYRGKLIQLTQDIQYDGVTPNNYTPISGFQGTFDGCGHTISGIDVTDTKDNSYGVALFRYIGEDGVVKNVSVRDSAFIDSDSYGACIAVENEGTIDNCHNCGVSAYAGIVYYNYGTVMNCSSTGEVTSSIRAVGGIANFNRKNGQILNCCNLGNIYSTKGDGDTSVGGIAGKNEGTVQNCYNTGIIDWKKSDYSFLHKYIGGITGENSETAIVANSYCSEESTDTNFGSMDGVEKNCNYYPAANMMTETFANLLNTNRGSNTDWMTWEIHTDRGIPYPMPGTGAFPGSAGSGNQDDPMLDPGQTTEPEQTPEQTAEPEQTTEPAPNQTPATD